MLKHIFIIILLFFYVFGVPFSFFPTNTSKLVLVLLLTLFIVSFFSKADRNLKINKNIYYILIYLVILFFMSIVYTTFHETNDFSIPYVYLIMLFEVFLGSILFYKLFLYKYSFKQLLGLFIWIALIQSIVIILMFVLEPFRDFIMSVSKNDITDLTERYGGFRGFGLASSVTYDLAVFLSINMMFITYLISINKEKRFFYIFSWLTIFIAVLMTGRTGWIGVFLSLVILFYFIKNKNSLKSIGILLGSIFMFIFLIIYILTKYYPNVYDTLILNVIPYAFEMFFNLYEVGSFSTASSDHIAHMYFDVPINTLLFGDGYYKNPYGEGYYMAVDAGYMRQMLFYGLVPSGILYAFYIFGFYKIYNNTKYDKNIWILIVLMCGYFFLAHYKGDFLTGSPMNIKLFFIILIFTVLSINSKKKKSCLN